MSVKLVLLSPESNRSHTMIAKRILPILIVLALILSLFICGIGIYISKLEKTNLQHKREVFAEKEAIKLELKQLYDNYDKIEVSNEQLQEELDSSKATMDSLYEAIDNTSLKLSSLRIYRSQIDKLRKDKVRLLKANDSLITVNFLMKDSLNLKDSQIEKYFNAKTALYSENLALTSEIKKRKMLSFKATNGIGARVKKSGKIVVTDRIKKLEKLRICTSIKPNTQLISESKRIYFKVFNPKKILVGKPVNARYKSKSILYSATHKFFYQNQSMDICKFIDAKSTDLIPGEYTIEVYLNHELQDISQFVLR